jgi:glycerol kinase
VGDRLESQNHSDVTALAWVRDRQPTYAVEGIINCSSATIDWLKNQLGLISDAAESEDLARSVSDNGGVYLVPAFVGLSAPYWKPEARAAIVGMTSASRKAHVVRAALESIAYQIKDALDSMRSSGRPSPRMLLADGGPTRNTFLMQFTADILQREIEVAEVAESSARGVAQAAMLGLNKVSSLNELSPPTQGARLYRPQMDVSTADRLYSEWQTAVKRVL